MSKFTIGAAALFMLSALMISMPALSGNVSVLQGSSEEAPAAAPAETTPAPDAPPTTDANVVPGQTQQIVIPADSNSNAAVLNVPATPVNSAPANAAPANK